MTSRFSNPRTLVATATYNERDNIDLLLQEIFRLQGDLDALVIDDASPDGTGDYLRSLAASNSRLHLVQCRGRQSTRVMCMAQCRRVRWSTG